ncbi:hypothetical protein D9M71_287930 [compost metagenome]
MLAKLRASLESTQEVSEMKKSQVFLAALLVLGSSFAVAEDGSMRSIEMNNKFRESQARLWGEKQDRQKEQVAEVSETKSAQDASVRDTEKSEKQMD